MTLRVIGNERKDLNYIEELITYILKVTSFIIIYLDLKVDGANLCNIKHYILVVW